MDRFGGRIGFCPFGEASHRDRIGGRVFTDRAAFRAPVEVGAEYIHGTTTDAGDLNPVWEMAKAMA